MRAKSLTLAGVPSYLSIKKIENTKNLFSMQEKHHFSHLDDIFSSYNYYSEIKVGMFSMQIK